MRPLATIARLIWRADPWAITRGAAAALAVLLAGVALLGLSGWFIVATGAAGLAGIGIAFDVFRPSAGIRFLALGRAGARYAERLLTHDATLRALAGLRLSLLDRLAVWRIDALRSLRGSVALTRIVADVDALDGVLLRLVLPVAACVLTLLAAGLGLWWLTTPGIALSVGVGLATGATLVLWRTVRAAARPARQAEAQRQALRRALIDLLRTRRDATMTGRLAPRVAEAAALGAAALDAEDTVDRVDRAAGLGLGAVLTAVATAALGLAGLAVEAGALAHAPAAIGFFVALALAEAVQPLRRGMIELGRMAEAAKRVLPEADAPERPPTRQPDRAPDPLPAVPARPDGAPLLAVDRLSVARPGRTGALIAPLSFTVAAGETVALAAPSGTGKSLVLDAIAGVAPPLAGQAVVLGTAVDAWPESGLRGALGLVPQRARLVAGSLLDNLRVARDGVTEAEARTALSVVRLDPVVARLGLHGALGEGGAGLSGGEARRLVLARAILRRPAVLLLDEPTEGLQDALAQDVLAAIRDALPDAAIVMASHRGAELAAACRTVRLQEHTANREHS